MNMIAKFIKIFIILKKKLIIKRLKKLYKELSDLERKITLFHAKVLKKLM